MALSSQCGRKKSVEPLDLLQYPDTFKEALKVYPGGHEEEDEGDNREERREGETSK